MNLIQNNPYRIIGILANASAKDIQSQKGKLQAFARVGKEITSEYDFLFLQHIDRDEETINRAFSKIEQNQGKVIHSLFWFIDANQIDKTAIQHLIGGNKEKAIEIWRKITLGKEVNAKNISAFNNIGTLYLSGRYEEEIKQGIETKIKLIESENFIDFVHTVTDEMFSIDKNKQIEILINELLTQFKNKYSASETMELFSNCSGTTQKHLSKKFAEEPIHKIEAQIEQAKKKRKEEKSDTNRLGTDLYKNTQNQLSLLKSILGTENLQYKMLADNVAKEIMQCAINYFKEWQESKDPSKETLSLLNVAKSITVNHQTKDRIEDNIKGVQEFAETALIKADLDFILEKLEELDFKGETKPTFNKENMNKFIMPYLNLYIKDVNESKSIKEILEIVNKCKPHLQNIKTINNELYLNLSSAVVNKSLNSIISIVNRAQKEPSGNSYTLIAMRSFTGLEDFSYLEKIVSLSLDTFFCIGKLDMLPDISRYYNTNYNTIKSIARKLGKSTESPPDKQKKKIKDLQNKLQVANQELEKIEEWQLFRSKATREKQIDAQKERMRQLELTIKVEQSDFEKLLK